MSFRKKTTSHSRWETYCEAHQALLEALQVPDWVFIKESNFRAFATTGQIHDPYQDNFDFDSLAEDLFWDLFTFITDYFDHDSLLFTKFEEARVKKGSKE
ncbi:MAG: hypothetical protein AAF587_43170 [Bacteroidota bacterium]